MITFYDTYVYKDFNNSLYIAMKIRYSDRMSSLQFDTGLNKDELYCYTYFYFILFFFFSFHMH